MSKKKEKRDLESVNPFDFGYKPDQAVEVSGFLFAQMKKSLMDIMKDERKEFFEEIQDEDDQADIEATLENRKPKTYYTDRGRYFLRLYYEIMIEHGKNIESGVAVPLEELKMNKVD
jgi:hypothetical protein